MPWVGFGYDRPHTFEFLNRDALATLGRSLDDLEREALRNLHRRRATWERVDVKLGLFKKLRIMACGDDFLSAERILDVTFMREAQDRLRARGLLVGIPRRGYLVAMDGEAGAERATPFVSLVAMQYREPESAPISPLVFALKDGEIVGIIEAGASQVEAAGERGHAGEGVPDVSGLVLRNESTGLEDVEIMIDGSDFGKVSYGAVCALAEAMSRHRSRPEFSGKVRVLILGVTPDAMRAELPRLEEHLRGLAEETGPTDAGRPIVVSVREQEGAPLGEAPTVTTTVVKDPETGRTGMHILAGGADFEKLSDAVVSAVMAAYDKHAARPEFGGAMRITILRQTPEAVRAKLPSLKEKLRGVSLGSMMQGPKVLRFLVEEEGGPSEAVEGSDLLRARDGR
jgi:hypothetical protein